MVFIDPALRMCVAGDACNSNTLLAFGNALPVEQYLKNLLHLNKFRDMFDILYCGHQVLPVCTIDEAIETCAKVLAGTDAKDVRPGLFGTPVTYAEKVAESGFGRADGKNFNMCYKPENRFGDGESRQEITLAPANIF